MRTCLLVPLLLIGVAAANINVLGSYNVSLNLSTPANYTQMVPSYFPNIDVWSYTLNITPDAGGYILVIVTEYNTPIYGSKLLTRASENLVNQTREKGLGNIKYGTITYKEHDAFEMSYPAQRVQQQQDGPISDLPGIHMLMYRPDERSGVTIEAVNADEGIFKEVIDSMNIVKNSTIRG